MTTARPAAPSLRIDGVRTALLVVGLGGVATAALAGLAQGQAEMLGALVGAALVCAFFLFGSVSTNVAAALMPSASLLVALLTYVLQVVGLWVAMLAISRSGLTDEAVDPRWLAGSVIVGTLLWVAALCVGALAHEGART